MSLYLGNQKIDIIYHNNIPYKMNFYSTVVPMIPNGVLISSDNYILLDKNGTYLIAKEDN